VLPLRADLEPLKKHQEHKKIVDAQRRPKKRQDGFSGGGREAADEGCEINDRHGNSLEMERAEDVAPA